ISVSRPHIRPDRCQVRRPVEGGDLLDDRAVRAAHHPHPAVRPRLGRDPLDRVVPVWTFVHVGGVKVLAGALRAMAAAEILEYHDVAARHEEIGDRIHPLLGRSLVVRGPAEDGWELSGDWLAILGYTVDIRRETDAVPHWHHDIFGDDDST